jgi:hypothetical protein
MADDLTPEDRALAEELAPALAVADGPWWVALSFRDGAAVGYRENKLAPDQRSSVGMSTGDMPWKRIAERLAKRLGIDAGETQLDLHFIDGRLQRAWVDAADDVAPELAQLYGGLRELGFDVNEPGR